MNKHQAIPPLLTTPDLLASHIDALIRLEPRFALVYRHTGLPKLRLHDDGFLQLYQIIVSQQLSVAAASSIWQRLLDSGLDNEAALLSADGEQLRRQGLSRQKIRYIQSLAQHHIDYPSLWQLPDEAVIAILTAVTGIGRWTAEIYCLFSLRRSDIFAANDLALQAAAQQLLQLSERPRERQMRTLAAKWSPYRSAAAYLLWAYYRVLKQREGVL
ncbi:MAG: 3-methyladenine DNA glycosylase [Gammaproteobacteria bacterium]|nr:MAG: 3-methyladenine DNA glycosylase [Gammaproteobacteria bacterium]